jgi:mannose-6-phosphate isomerase-like protein (cupin superfamily)
MLPQRYEEAAMKFALPFTIALAAVAGVALAQGQPRGSGTVILNKEIMSAVQKTAKDAVNDSQIRIVSINGEYNVGVGVVHRARTAGRDIGGGIEHSEITEVYHIISGTGTLVLGGNIENAKATPADSPVVRILNGPTTGGGRVVGGTATTLGPGDVVIIPPNTPHWWTDIPTDQVVYLVVRMDPKKVLPTGYALK